MGTRSDFYIGRGRDAEWLGSIAFDGYPDGRNGLVEKYPELFRAKDVQTWRVALGAMLRDRDDATFPEHGWPWPWDDSGTSSYAYTFDDGKVWVSDSSPYTEVFEYLALSDEEKEARFEKGAKQVFPDMSARKNVTFGGRSGLLVITPEGPVDQGLGN